MKLVRLSFPHFKILQTKNEKLQREKTIYESKNPKLKFEDSEHFQKTYSKFKQSQRPDISDVEKRLREEKIIEKTIAENPTMTEGSLMATAIQNVFGF